MAEDAKFKYFPDYERWARFTDRPAECGGPYLEGVYFEDPDVPDAVCLQDLISGRHRVYVPDYLRQELEKSTMATYPDWPSGRAREHIQRAIDELSRTPPVPWIQPNRWPVHQR